MLIVHIAAGTISLLAGAAAMMFRKGGDRHRVSGQVFVGSMLVLALTGAVVGFSRGQVLNGSMGILTTYLVITAWLTARRVDGEAGTIDLALLAAPLGVAATLGFYGLEAANSETGMLGGFSATGYFVFGTLALVFAAGDVSMLMRGGVAGAPRIGRHLRRMCVAWFISTGSFFLGQPQVFPESLRNTPVLLVAGLLPLALLVFWQFRYKRIPRGVYSL